MELLLDRISMEYRKKRVIDDISLTLSSGIYGLLGPNGAGKTTIMKIISGNALPSAGKIFCDGKDIFAMGASYLSLIGYMPQQQSIYPFFSGRMFLNYMGNLKGIPKDVLLQDIESIAKSVNLSDRLDDLTRTYSGGMKQRLIFAQALLGNPKIVLLDEPTAGLDPMERIRVGNMIANIAKDRIVLVSTHILQDIEYFTDRLILLRKGSLILNASMNELIEMMKGRVWEVMIKESDIDDYKNQYSVSRMFREQSGIRCRIVSECKPDGAVSVEPDMTDSYMFFYGDKTYEYDQI